MRELTEQEHKNLKNLGVHALYLFGSRAQGVESPSSDFDFAVLLDQETEGRGGGLYDKLYAILSPLCKRTTIESDVLDIVFLNTVSLEMRMHVVRYGKVLSDGNLLARLRFEERTTREYCDFSPILFTIDRTILATL